MGKALSKSIPSWSCDQGTTSRFSWFAAGLDQSRQATTALDAYLLAYGILPAGSLIRCDPASPPPAGQCSFLPVFDSPAHEEWISRITVSHWPIPRVMADGSTAHHKKIPGQENRTIGLAGVVQLRQTRFSVAPMRAAKHERRPRSSSIRGRAKIEYIRSGSFSRKQVVLGARMGIRKHKVLL